MVNKAMAAHTADSDLDDASSGSSDEDVSFLRDLNTERHGGKEIVPYRFEPVGAPETESEGAAASTATVDEGASERSADSQWWCTCGNCAKMAHDAENRFCCKEMNALRPTFERAMEELDADLNCITDHPGFSEACLAPYALKVAYLSYITYYGKIEKPQHQKYRYTAYRQFIRLFIGHLGKHCRIPLPACVMTVIRNKFPAEDSYVGFKKAPKLD